MVFRGFILLAYRPFSSFFSLPADFFMRLFKRSRKISPPFFGNSAFSPFLFSFFRFFLVRTLSLAARFFSFRPRSLASRVFSFHPFSFLRSLFLSVRMKEALSLSTPDPIAPLVLFMPSLFLIKFSAFQSKKLFPYKMLSACAFQRRFFSLPFFRRPFFSCKTLLYNAFKILFSPPKPARLRPKKKSPFKRLTGNLPV